MTENRRHLTCAMCGHVYDPTEHVGCAKCPFSGGCMLACCPACGYEAPDPERSGLVQLTSRLRDSLRRSTASEAADVASAAQPLSTVQPGSQVRIDGFEELSSNWCEQLQAYGLAPGRCVEVVQQSPVTMVRIEHIDLAFEDRIARGIRTVPA